MMARKESAMVARERLHQLLDTVDDAALPQVEQYLEYLRRGGDDPMRWALDNAPLDDEPSSSEEDERDQAAWEEYQRGETISAEEAKRLLLP